MPYLGDIYYYVCKGSGSALKPPLILIHGAAGSHLSWPHELRRLKGADVYALDLPAHGKSRGQARQSITTYARIVYEWLIGLEFSSAVFAGHSMGGAIAMTLALKFPEFVSGLVLLGTGARIKIPEDILQYTESDTTSLKAVKQVVDLSFSPRTSFRLKDLVMKRLMETRTSVMNADFHACNEFDVMGMLSRIQKPTLVACGEFDQFSPLRYSYYLAEQIPDSRLIVVPDAGHMLQLEKPTLVAVMVQEFLNGLPYN